MDKSGKPSFLKQLGELARDVDQRERQFQENLQDNKDFCAPQALKTINDKLKLVRQTQANIESSIVSLGEDRAILDEIIKLGTVVINKQKPVIAGLELYLNQYGYTPRDKADSATKPNKDVEESKIGDGKANGIVRSITPRDKPKTKEVNRTPQIEDAGISQMTMDYLNSISKPKFQRPVPVPNAARQRIPSGQRIPAVFEHNGFVCTPGFMGDKTYSVFDHAAFASPDTPVLQTRPIAPEQKPPVASTTITSKYDPLCSPVSPELYTQTWSHTKGEQKWSYSQGYQNTKRSVNTELFRTNAAMKPSVCVDTHDEDLTYSLEPLEDMTGMHMFMPRKDVDIALVAPSSQIHDTLATQSKQISHGKENVTPEFSYNVKLETAMSTPERKQPTNLFLAATPKTPELYGNYDV